MAALAVMSLCPWSGVRAQDEAPLAPQVRSEIVVTSGDTWTSLRSRFCPIEIFEAANPRLTTRALQPGDRVRSPLVAASELERANDANAELEASLAREMDQRLELQGRVESLSALEGELAEARAAQATSERIRSLLLYPLVGGFLLFAIAAGIALMLRVEGARVRTRLGKSEAEFAELRRSLQGLEAQMQRRVLELVAQHKGQPISEELISRTSRPVIELAERIRRRHAS